MDEKSIQSTNIFPIIDDIISGASIDITKKLLTTNGIMEFSGRDKLSKFDRFDFPATYYGKNMIIKITYDGGKHKNYPIQISENLDFSTDEIPNITKLEIVMDDKPIQVFICRQIYIHNSSVDEKSEMSEFNFIDSMGYSVDCTPLEDIFTARDLWINGVRIFVYHGDYYELMSDPYLIIKSAEKYYAIRYIKKNLVE